MKRMIQSEINGNEIVSETHGEEEQVLDDKWILKSGSKLVRSNFFYLLICGLNSFF